MIRKLTPTECNHAADALGDTPETVICIHVLRRGLGDAFVLDSTPQTEGIIIQNHDMPDEPTAFGSNPEVIWQILQEVPGWFCVNVDTSLAKPLAALMERDLKCAIRFYGDVYYALKQPVIPHPNEAVRLMTFDDLDLIQNAPEEVRPNAFGDARELLTHGYLACAVVDGQIVALAQTYARSGHYADIGVVTLETYRQRGFSSAATALVAERVQADGQIPAWSTGEDNIASQRVAQKVGFEEVHRRMYLIMA